MKQALPLLLALLLVGCASGAKKSAALKHMTVRTTAYTHSEAGGHSNAIDGRLHFGGNVYSAAADWSWLPLGTRFKMTSNGREYVIEDYGAALVGRQTIDLYVPSMGEVRGWGVKSVDIDILEWGSKAMSLKLLQPRAKKEYIQTMVSQLQKDVPSDTGKLLADRGSHVLD